MENLDYSGLSVETQAEDFCLSFRGTDTIVAALPCFIAEVALN